MDVEAGPPENARLELTARTLSSIAVLQSGNDMVSLLDDPAIAHQLACAGVDAGLRDDLHDALVAARFAYARSRKLAEAAPCLTASQRAELELAQRSRDRAQEILRAQLVLVAEAGARVFHDVASLRARFMRFAAHEVMRDVMRNGTRDETRGRASSTDRLSTEPLLEEEVSRVVARDRCRETSRVT